MSITFGSVNSVQTNTDSAVGLKTAGLVKNQQETEAEMALKLIETAALVGVSAPTASSGTQINIKV